MSLIAASSSSCETSEGSNTRRASIPTFSQRLRHRARRTGRPRARPHERWPASEQRRARAKSCSEQRVPQSTRGQRERPSAALPWLSPLPCGIGGAARQSIGARQPRIEQLVTCSLELLGADTIFHRRGVRKERQARALHGGAAEHGTACHVGQQLSGALVRHILEQRQRAAAGVHNAVRRHGCHVQRILNRGRSSRILARNTVCRRHLAVRTNILGDQTHKFLCQLIRLGKTRASDRPRDRQARGSPRHSEQPSRTARHPVLPQTRSRYRRREPARVQPTPRQNRDRFYPSSLGSSKHLCPPRRPPRAARIIKNGTTTPGSGCPIHRSCPSQSSP